MTPVQLRTAILRVLPRGSHVYIRTSAPHPRGYYPCHRYGRIEYVRDSAHHFALAAYERDGTLVFARGAGYTCTETYRALCADYTNAIFGD